MARDEQYRLLWSTVSNSRKLRSVSGDKWFRIGCHLVYSWLIPWTDDDGRLRGEPIWILANILPNEGLTVDEICSMLFELGRVGLIHWYEVEGEKFIQVIDNENHQLIRKDRYKTSIYPPFSESATTCQPNDNQMSDNAQQICNPLPTPSPSPSPTPSPTHSRRRRLAADVPVHRFFEDFWTAYPKKKNRVDALKSFNAINPDQSLVQVMIDKIAKEKLTSDWTKDEGQYIPYPATWLNGRRWEDEGTEVHPLSGKVSSTTLKSIENLKSWSPKNAE